LRLVRSWWFLALGGVFLLTARQPLLACGWQDAASAVFVVALLSYLTGIGGLIAHHLRVKSEDGSGLDRPPARPHRSRCCKIERTLVDKVARALRSLRDRAQEKLWDAAQGACEEHQALAENLLACNDLAGAFREYCRALLPLMPFFHTYQ
jgi:hypothetical protein